MIEEQLKPRVLQYILDFIKQMMEDSQIEAKIAQVPGSLLSLEL